MKKIIHIAETILSIANGYEVTHIAIEDSYVDKKYQGTGKTLARLFGAVYITLYINGYTLIYTYTPSQWKKITTGVGNKSKEGTHKWVCDNMPLACTPELLGVPSNALASLNISLY